MLLFVIQCLSWTLSANNTGYDLDLVTYFDAFISFPRISPYLREKKPWLSLKTNSALCECPFQGLCRSLEFGN